MELSTIILLCLIAFLAGYVDAVVGGGGLIQVPAGLILMPTQAVSTIIGTLKVPSFIGTCFATYQYLQRVKRTYKVCYNQRHIDLSYHRIL